jgi:tetratricopeptide (TPR) repeat protein
MYGEESYNLLFTLKNIGTCFLGVGNSEKARDYFEQCIELLEKCKTTKPEIIKKDKEEISSLHQNLYLTFVSDRNYILALQNSEKVLEIMSDIYGPRSKRLSSKYYQKANSLLNLRRREEAIEAILHAISIFEKPDPELEGEN